MSVIRSLESTIGKAPTDLYYMEFNSDSDSECDYYIRPKVPEISNEFADKTQCRISLTTTFWGFLDSINKEYINSIVNNQSETRLDVYKIPVDDMVKDYLRSPDYLSYKELVPCARLTGEYWYTETINLSRTGVQHKTLKVKEIDFTSKPVLYLRAGCFNDYILDDVKEEESFRGAEIYELFLPDKIIFADNTELKRTDIGPEMQLKAVNQ